LSSDRLGESLVLLSVVVLFTGLYGASMGFPGGARQAISSAIKAPLLFLLTLLVCLPVLHVTSVRMGSGLTLSQTICLTLWGLALNSLLLASFAPISAFFGLGSGYHFLKLFHVAVLAVCGIWAMGTLQRGIAILGEQTQGAPGLGAGLFRVWVLVFAFVCSQMTWTLRPFIGEPHLPFQLFRRRDREMNFYSAVWESVRAHVEKDVTSAKVSAEQTATAVTAQHSPS
jgi:hypothetical protein